MNNYIEKLSESKTLKAALKIAVCIVVLLLVFGIGMAVGFKTASFSYRWGENYHNNFGGPRNGFFSSMSSMMGLRSDDFISANGVFGQIIKIDLATSADQTSTLIIRSSKAEKPVLIDDDTVIKKFQETIKPSDLKVDDSVVVIGDPNSSGQIDAKLIRVMPSPMNSIPPLPNK